MIAKSIKPLDPRTILEVVHPPSSAGANAPRRELERLLVVEDNPGDARLLQVLFDEQGSPRTKVTHVECLKDAEAFLAAHDVDIILLDLGLPDAQGLEAVRRVHLAAPDAPLVVLTGLDDETIATQALQEGAQDYLVKGQIETRGLLRALRYSVERKALEEALAEERALAEEALVAELAARKQAQDALETAQLRLDHVVSSSPIVLFLLKMNGGSYTLDWISRNVERLVGCPHGGVTLEWWVANLHPEDKERTLSELQRLLAGNGIEHVELEYRFLKCDGEYEWLGTNLRLLRDEQGLRVEAIGCWSSITARKETEQRLQESEEQYRLLFDSNPHPMYVFDAATLDFLAVNDAAVTHYGYSREEFLGMSLPDLRRGEDLPELLRALEKARLDRNGSAAGVFSHRRKNGTIVQMDIAAKRIHLKDRPAWLALALDVTEKRDLESRLVQAQKMDSVGRLAGGVAHDFNNILGVITGYGELLSRRVSGDPRLRKYADDIVRAAERGAGLTRQLLAFSRKQVLQPRVLDLNVVVGDMERMLRRVIGEDVQLVTVFDDQLGAVTADPGQMEQVLMNLAVNARDAMARGGRLTIETGNTVVDDAFSRLLPGVPAGRYVMLAVSDTGQGMSKEVLARAFEPFYTTKDPGKGTGLGLATVHGIVKQSDGHIWADSELGRGTNFKIYLPRIDAETEREQPATAIPVDPPRGVETVLLVEDEESLREIIRECLEDSGYIVIDASDGEAAVDVCTGYEGTIDLLITDVVMPGIGGREVAERLQALRPRLRTLYMSGYTDDAVVLHGVMAEDMDFLQKPFTALALATKVRQVLDAAR